MSTPLEILEELENSYIENKRSNEKLQEILNKLDQYNQSVDYIPYRPLILSIKTSILKQKIENENFSIDGWKQHLFTQRNSVSGRPKTCVDRNILVYLLSIGMNNSEIAKIFHVHRNSVIQWKNDHNLNNVLNNPSDDNVITQHLQDVLDAYPNMGELYARGLLLSKGIKINRVRLRNILRNIKQSTPMEMNPIRRRTYNTRTANSMWHIDSTHKLIHWRFVISGAVDGYSRMIIWLKCANNNKAETVYNHFIKSITEFQCPYQVRGDKGSENRLIAKHMMILRGSDMNGFIGGRSTHNTRIERLWREYNNNVMDKFSQQFKHLEQIGILDRNNNIDIWALHKVYMQEIQNKLNEFRSYYNDHPIRTARGKTPKQMHIISGLKDQVVNTIISPKTHYILQDWQNAWDTNHVNHVEVPEIKDYQLSENQLNHIQNIMVENIELKNKYANIRLYLTNEM